MVKQLKLINDFTTAGREKELLAPILVYYNNYQKFFTQEFLPFDLYIDSNAICTYRTIEKGCLICFNYT